MSARSAWIVVRPSRPGSRDSIPKPSDRTVLRIESLDTGRDGLTTIHALRAIIIQTLPRAFLLILSLFIHINVATALPTQRPFIVAAYYENWSQFRPGINHRKPFSIDLIDPHLITDLYYAFAIFGFVTSDIEPNHSHLTGDFKIRPLYSNEQNLLYQQVLALKQKSGGQLRTFLSIGGANFNNPNDPYGIGKWTYKLFSQMVANPANRRQFIDSAIAYAHQYGFDGIDIDWEYPGDLTKGGTLQDLDNCLIFLKECSKALHSAQPPLLLSFAIPASVPEGMIQSYRDHPNRYYQWIAQCAAYLDRLSVMAYNYHTSSDSSKITGVNAPLDKDTDPNSSLSVARTLENYIKNGVPPHKMLLGLPLYGWSYGNVSRLNTEDSGPGKPYQTLGPQGLATRTPGMLAYFEIADLIALKQLELKIDSITHTAYGYNIGPPNQWVSFDIPDTLSLKTKTAKNLGLGGVIFWAINLDEYQWMPTYPNIRAVSKGTYVNDRNNR